MKFKKVVGKQEWQCEYQGVIISVKSKKHVETFDLYVGTTWFSKDLDKEVLFDRARQMFGGGL
jgi:hypothetical protein